MRSRSVLAAVAAAAAAIPAVAVAEGLGPHSTWYDQHPRPKGPVNDVSIIWHRDKGTAQLTVMNYCLSPSGSRYPESANVSDARVKKHAISYDGKALVAGPSGTSQVTMKFTATLGSTKATGEATFPTVKACGTLRFTAKLAGKTK